MRQIMWDIEETRASQSSLGSTDNVGFRWSLLTLILNYIAGKLIIIFLVLYRGLTY